MQLFALDSNNEIISAHRAAKQRDYICIECRGKVRVRAGLHRRHHFFHAHTPSPCRLSGKSMIHLQIQCHLERNLPSGDAALEWRFPEIDRIADVVWFTRKIVFEVQCSPIAAEEISQRNHDYASLGYQVVWILHDSRYNQYRLSGAEIALRTTPHYFTNMDSDGRGYIYDQFHIVLKGVRPARLQKCPINFSRPMEIEKNASLPRSLMQRVHFWNIGFEGDLLDRSVDLEEAFSLEERFFPRPKPISRWQIGVDLFWYWVIRPYNIIIQMMLERACR